MNKLDGIFVYDIDDLQSVVASNLTDRKSEAERAEQIVEAEVDKCLARFNEQEIVPTIVSLQEQIETIRQAEIDRARGRLGALNPDQELAVDALTKAIVNKILHTPITTLKSAAREAESTTLEKTIRMLFNLKADAHKKDRSK
jgi:glutamyl-tRNA reductase